MPRADQKIPRTSAGPALWRYAQLVYADMAKGAETMLVDSKRQKVYKGPMTGLCSRHHISNPYYGPLTKFLRDNGSVSLIRRGNSFSESLWLVGKKPTKAEFESWQAQQKTTKIAASGRRRTKEFDQVNASLQDVLKRVGTIDLKKAFAAVQKDIGNIMRRLDKLEAAVYNTNNGETKGDQDGDDGKGS